MTLQKIQAGIDAYAELLMTSPHKGSRLPAWDRLLTLCEMRSAMMISSTIPHCARSPESRALFFF